MHQHDHSHHHGAPSQANRRRLTIVLVLVVVYMVAEVIGGIVSNSLALLADAGHMLSDAGALALSLAAMWLAQRPPTPRLSYGFHRTEILAALANGATLVGVALFIFLEAIERLSDPQDIAGPVMMIVATGGLAVNLVGLAVLHGGQHDSHNVRGAWLHVLSDTLGSAGAILAGALVYFLGWRWADPVISMIIGVLVVLSSWKLLRDTVGVLMESAPSGIDVNAVRDAMSRVSGARSVHDLHVWSITTGMVALSAHVETDDVEGDAMLERLRKALHDEFGIHHVTIQLERTPCTSPSHL